MLDLLIINIEAGVGLDGAIHRSVERLQMPLTFELHRVLTEISAGKSRVLALREMAERLRIEQLSLIVASIQQSEQMGTSIGQALRQQADQLRRRRSNELREIAAKLPIKLLFPIVLFIFPTLFMVLLGPGIIKLFRSDAFG
jgi:tight adherence protein C